MSFFNAGFTRRLAVLTIMGVATSAAASNDDRLLREMSRSDGDPMGDHGALHLRPHDPAPVAMRLAEPNGAGDASSCVPAGD